MTKADRVHSTPRRTASKIQTKKRARESDLADRALIDASDRRHAKAFRDLEGRISDCVTMAGIGVQMICNARDVEGEVVFVVSHTSTMLTELKADYYAAYHGERDVKL
jgi:hypothetical protein